MKKAPRYTDGKTDKELIGHIGFGEPVSTDTEKERNVLITGAGSYIGESFREYAEKYYPALKITILDLHSGSWRDVDFAAYDVVYHVAGIAHVDVSKADEATREKYYAINTDLAVEVCKKARDEGVKEFIFMSSLIVYGDSAPIGAERIVNEQTVPKAATLYGDSKLQADVAVRSLATEKFKVIVLRAPMVYGRGAQGNYPVLSKLAKRLPVFPDVENERSMLYIENLCEFLCQLMLIRNFREDAVVLIPQNAEWIKTSEMAGKIAGENGKKLCVTRCLRPFVFMGSRVPGKIGRLVNKAFGNSCCAHELSVYEGLDYQIIGFCESIRRTEYNG